MKLSLKYRLQADSVRSASDWMEAVFLSSFTRLHCYVYLASACLTRVFVLMWMQLYTNVPHEMFASFSHTAFAFSSHLGVNSTLRIWLYPNAFFRFDLCFQLIWELLNRGIPYFLMHYTPVQRHVGSVTLRHPVIEVLQEIDRNSSLNWDSSRANWKIHNTHNLSLALFLSKTEQNSNEVRICYNWLLDRLFQIELAFNYWNICWRSKFIIPRPLCWEITRNNAVNYFEFCPVFDKDSSYFWKGDAGVPSLWRVPILLILNFFGEINFVLQRVVLKNPTVILKSNTNYSS